MEADIHVVAVTEWHWLTSDSQTEVEREVTMPERKIGKFTPESVGKLHEELKPDEVGRNAAISEIRRSLPAFVETRFDLTPQQRKNMHRMMPKEVADTVGAAVISVLEHDGDLAVQMTDADGAPPSIRMETLAKSGSISISISISICC